MKRVPVKNMFIRHTFCEERIKYDMPKEKTKNINKEVRMEKKVKRAIPTEIYSRVVGYYRPVQNWNKGKKEEFKDRESFAVNGTDKE